MFEKYVDQNSDQDLGQMSEELKKNKSIAISLEVARENKHRQIIKSISIASKTTPIYIIKITHPQINASIRNLLNDESIVKIIHGGLDAYIAVKNYLLIDMENIVCTMLGERCLTVGKQHGGLDFKSVCKKYLESSCDDIELEAKLLLQVADKIKARIIEENLTTTWMIENRAIQSFGDMNVYGQKIDHEAWLKIINENKGEADQLKKRLDYFFSSVCDNLSDTDEYMELDINYDSQQEVLEKLQMMNIHIDGELISNTNKKTQKKVPNHPILSVLAKYRSATKGKSSFGMQYVQGENPATGRIHFDIDPYGTNTGRPSCSGLNCLNIPKDPRYRRAFTTDTGRLLSAIDCNGAESRIIAGLSGDRKMIAAFNNKVDIHCYAAGLIFGKTVTKENENANLRVPAKRLAFGMAYGLGPRAFHEDMISEGYNMSFEESKSLYYKYQREFSTATEWLKDGGRTGRESFFIRNINGRARSWLHKESGDDESYLAQVAREAANFRVQSVNADIIKIALASTRTEYKRKSIDARLYNTIYDDIIYDFKEDRAHEAHEIQKQIMINSAEKILKNVPMEVEGKLGPTWG